MSKVDRRTKTCLWGMSVVLAFALAGCGADDGPRLARAKGVLKFDGKPLPNVGITFFPTGSGPMAVGRTNEQGEFVMMTTSPGDGACIGTHQVTLGAAEEGSSEFSALVQIPARYEMPATSGLTVEVKEGEANDFALEISN